MIRIFLAYASEDKEAVTHLYQRLKERGFAPWLDKVDLLPGQSWRAKISKAIKDSDIFIACLSQQSIQKQGYIQREFRMALNAMADRPPAQIFLIPVRLDACQIPELRQEEYGIRLTDYQWVNLFEMDGFEKLIQSINYHFPQDENSKTIDLGSGISLELVYIPDGKFLMGAPESEEDSYDEERPQHEVTVSGFWIGKYPVTQAQYQAVIGSNPSEFKGANLPVDSVSWNRAISFCEKLSKKVAMNFRLPSEAEWEYACRAGTTTPFYFGEILDPEHAGFDSGATYIVGTYPPNDFDLFDMHSNVWEWCQDLWNKNYEGAPYDGSAWTKGGCSGLRVVRGGSYIDDPDNCRSARRSFNHPGNRDLTVGFRIVSSATHIGGINESNRPGHVFAAMGKGLPGYI